MPKILLIDTLYDDFIRTVPVDPNAGYEENLQRILARGFGTADFYSRNLRALGWDAVDVIANHKELQAMWARENGAMGMGATLGRIIMSQIVAFDPDCVFLQDVSLFGAADLEWLSNKYLLAAQISCPMPPLANVSKLHCVFTSFPHFVKRFEELSVRATYLPLAFEPSVIEPATISALCKESGSTVTLNYLPPPARIHDVVFIGGVGNPSHWRYGMEVLETVAREIDGFRWWGYGHHKGLSDDLKTAFEGEAWGLDMFEVLLRSKIAIARHGEVAEGFANNMKLFETTGAGCLLMTEAAPNLSDFFAPDECVAYTSPGDAVAKIRYYLQHEDERAKIAAKGQRRTLRDHTYSQRMKVVSSALKEMLVHA